MGGTSPAIISNEELCTIGSDHAVVTWVTSRPCPRVTVRIGEDPTRLAGVTVMSDSEYHSVELTGLQPATRYWYQVESAGARGSLSCFQTLPAPEGKYLFSFGIITDAHVSAEHTFNDPNRLFLGKLSEHADVLLTQAILDAQERKVDLVVFTGDLTDTGDRSQYLQVRDEVLPSLGRTPYLLCIGNHDKFTRYGGVGERGFYEYLAVRERGYQSTGFKGYNFVLLDACLENDNLGYLDAAQLEWLEGTLRESGGRPAFVFLHHPANGFDLWFGLRNGQDLTRLIGRFPCVQGVFCGHMHRAKITTDRPDKGDLPYVEVPATVQYPCAYAVVRVYEKGYEYNSYKVSRLDLSELSRDRFILKSGGQAVFTWYSLGGLGDRCFSYSNGLLQRPELYELSITLNQARALRFYQQTQATGGSSLAPVNAGTTRVVLGRFSCLGLAQRAHREKAALYGVHAAISDATIKRTPRGDGGSFRPK